ncbi:MAG: hypothetical protein KAJ19_24650 [Gammaproteobacteria bacterium]|nr:hypothetical protein [Gammaproteobacteria bacterium]
MTISELPFIAKLIIAAIYDIIDAVNIIPGVGDILEVIVGGSLAYLLTENPKAVVSAGIDGILPPPIDFIPTTTAMVIADQLGWLD